MFTKVILKCVVRWVIGGAMCGAAVGQVETATSQREEHSIHLEKADQLRRDLRAMIGLARDSVFPALVNIQAITVDYSDGKETKREAVGSGTIISAEGHVLTNFHVADKGRKFKCTLASKEELSAELVGDDPLTDLAVLKLNLAERKKPQEPLAFAVFGNSDEIIVGDSVMVMGSPWALSRSVSLGIVSNTERVLTESADEGQEMLLDEHQRTGLFNRWIQHDASISPGNSGGPLVNLQGEVIGVNTRGSFFGGDMGFAIPSNLAKQVAAELIEHGEVRRSWFGFTLKSIKKSGFKEGVLVNSLDKNGPAEKAGMRPGDLILEVDGRAVTVWYPEEVPPLLKQLADYPIGSKVSLTVSRDGKTEKFDVVTEKLEKDRGDEAAFRTWGMVGISITPKMARERRLNSTEGVLVESVRSGSPAELAEPPILPGDVLMRVDSLRVEDLSGLLALYKKIMAQETLPEYLLVEFDRQGKNLLTLLKPKPDKDEDPPREVAKPWIGVAVQPVVPKLAKQMGIENALGFRVTRVYPGTLAASQGLVVGDVIVALNGEKLKPRGVQDAGLFHRKVRELNMDDQPKLTLIRGGEEQTLAVSLEPTRMTPEEARRDRNRDFELTVREVTFFDRDENRWDDSIQGVLVEKVEDAGWADLGGVQPGDLIQRVGEHAITNLADYRAAMEKVTAEKPERVVMVILRGVRSHFQYLEPDWTVADAPIAGTRDRQE